MNLVIKLGSLTSSCYYDDVFHLKSDASLALTPAFIWLVQQLTHTFSPLPFNLLPPCHPPPHPPALAPCCVVVFSWLEVVLTTGGACPLQVSSTPNNKTSDPSNPAAKARVSPYHLHPHTQYILPASLCIHRAHCPLYILTGHTTTFMSVYSNTTGGET